MNPTAARLRLALLTLAFVGALALSGVIQQGGVPRGAFASAIPGVIRHGWSITALRIGGKMHPDDITIGFVSRKAGKGPLEY